MTKILSIAILSVFLCVPIAPAGDNGWNREEVLLEIAWEAIHVIDWGTTRDMSRRLDAGYYEVNPLIGKHPPTSRVDLHMAIGAVIHPVITYLLPRTVDVFGLLVHPRRLWQSVSIGVSGACVINNISIGLEVRF